MPVDTYLCCLCSLPYPLNVTSESSNNNIDSSVTCMYRVQLLTGSEDSHDFRRETQYKVLWLFNQRADPVVNRHLFVSAGKVAHKFSTGHMVNRFPYPWGSYRRFSRYSRRPRWSYGFRSCSISLLFLLFLILLNQKVFLFLLLPPVNLDRLLQWFLLFLQQLLAFFGCIEKWMA